MRRLLAIGAMILAVTAAGYAQTGSVRGTVTDAATGQPLAGTSVVVRGTTFGALTNAQGQFEIRGVPAGTHTLEATRIGYSTATMTVTVSGGAAATASLALTESAVLLEGLTVSSASRRTEKITEAPATINVITAQSIDQHPSFNIGELTARQKGVDYVRTGVLGTGFNVRGFNSAFNPKNLQVNDGRLSTLVATGLPWGPLSTTVKDDIERVEIVLGPTAALYGPNAHNGLVNTITKDPRTSEGTTFALGGGSQSVVNGRLRHAQVVNERLAFKIAAEYTQGTEFEYVDSVYIGSGDAATAMTELELDRDFDSLHGEAALYYALDPTSDLILAYGGSKNNNLSPTNAGRNQIQDWILHVFQARYVSSRFFAQAYFTWSKSDSTYAINQRTQNYASFLAAGFSEAEARTRSYSESWVGPMDGGVALQRGAIFTDDSRRLNAEAQYNNTIAGVSFTVGGQFQRDMADSHGTYLLDQGGTIELNQYGFYGQVEAPLGESGAKAIFAARGDDHELYGFNFIPKGGLTYTRGNGTWRLTYGKGIAAPTILNLSMNLFGGLVLGNGEGFTLSDGSTIDPLEVETIQTFEAGYKGVLGQRVYFDANAYYNMSKNFISPLVNIAATAFAGGPLVTHRGSVPIDQYQPGLAIGPGDFVLTYLNFGEVNTYGLDLGLNYYLSDRYNVAFNYSYFDFSLDEDDPKNDGTRDGNVDAADLSLNTPTHKASVALNTSQERWYGSAFARWVQEYDFFSGINVAAATDTDLIYNGSPVVEGARVGRDFNEGPLGGFVTFDLSAGYRLSPRATIAGQVVNLFDSDVREFVASPAIRRLLSVELKLGF